MSRRQSTFPAVVWDGLAPTLANREQDKSADAPIADQHSAEIIAIEAYIKAYAEILRLIGNPNTVLGVNSAGTALEYKEIAAGSNITINHTPGTITINSSGGGGSGSSEDFSAINDNVSPIVIGQPVYIDVNNHVDLAQANDQTTVQVLGLVKDTSIASGGTGDIQTDGILTATTGQWDAVAGTTGGLNWGFRYFLDPANPGKLTEIAPSVAGDFVVRIGVAISTTELEISINPPIKL